MTTVLVAGIGHVGSHVAIRLLQEGYDVIGYDIKPSYKVDRSGNPFNPLFVRELEGVKFVKGSVIDFQQYLEVAKENDVDGIIHTPFAGLGSAGVDWSVARDVNVTGVLNALEITRMLNLRRLIYTSTGSVYGSRKDLTPIKATDRPHPDPRKYYYGLTKYLAEVMLDTYRDLYGVSAATIRLSVVHGGRERMDPRIILALEGKKIVFRIAPSGKERHDFTPRTHMKDTVSAICLLYTKPTDLKYTLYQVSSVKGITASGVAEALRKYIPQADIEVVAIPESEWLEPEGTRRGPYAMERLLEEFGWRPKYTVQEGIEEDIEYYKELKEKEPAWYNEQVRRIISAYTPPT